MENKVYTVGCWDMWENAPQEYLIHWSFMSDHFGVDKFHMTPNTGHGEELKNNNNEGTQTLHEANTIQEVISNNPDLTPVIIDENGDIELKDFTHPQKALYILGRTGYSPKENLNSNIASVRIPSWSKNENASFGLLHPHQALSIVLYDRKIKEWQ
jgi:hypothetical protein